MEDTARDGVTIRTARLLLAILIGLGLGYQYATVPR